MTATIIKKGGSMGSMMPLAVSGQAAMLSELQSKLIGALKAQRSLVLSPPSIAGSIETATKALAALQIAITGPSVALDFSALASLMAEIQAALSVLLSLKATFGSAGAGFALIKFDGKSEDFGGDLAAKISNGEIPGVNGESEGIGVMIMGSADPSSVALLKKIFAL